MKFSTRLAAYALSITSLYGCQAALYGTASDFNKIDVGMSYGDVVSKLGEPSSTEADSSANEQRLIYKRMAYVAGWAPTMYEVVLRNGKVTRYGERH